MTADQHSPTCILYGRAAGIGQSRLAPIWPTCMQGVLLPTGFLGRWNVFCIVCLVCSKMTR